VLCAGEARIARDVESARGTAAGLAVEDDVGVARKFVQAIWQLAEGDVESAVDVACIPFVWLANIDRDRVTDRRNLVQVGGIAKLVVVDESCDRGVRVMLLFEP
jgi:hypothetical protein